MPNLGAPELLIILVVVVMLFGAKRLPELARGSGRALRIFKTEVKGLHDDDEKPAPPVAPPTAIAPPTPVNPDVVINDAEVPRAAEAPRDQA